MPGRDKGLMYGDIVEITITKLGTQKTPVIKLKS